jgi:DNA primase
MKEVMFFREHFDWDTVAGKSENTMIQPHIMNKLFSVYKRVYIWLDKDTAGINAQEEYLKKYPKLIPVSYKDFVEQKDPTDRYEFMKKLGMKELALKEIKELIN